METTSNFYFIFFSECLSNRREIFFFLEKASLKVCLKEKEMLILEGNWVNPLLPVQMDAVTF